MAFQTSTSSGLPSLSPMCTLKFRVLTSVLPSLDRTQAIDLATTGIAHPKIDPHLPPLRKAGRQLVPGADVGHFDRYRGVLPGRHGCRHLLELYVPGAPEHVACALRALLLTEMLEHHRVGPAEPMRSDLLAVWPHDRGLARKTRHVAALASHIVQAVGALLPFIIGALHRHAAEGVRDVVAGAAKIRAGVQSGIDGVVIGRNGIPARAELGRFAVGPRAQDIGAVIEARAGTDVVAGLAIDPGHRMVLRTVFNRGAVDLRSDLPGRETDREYGSRCRSYRPCPRWPHSHA